jgi:hypothetical protein
MHDLKPVATLMTHGLVLSKINGTPASCHTLPYHQAIGSLLYLALMSCPDIAFAVNVLSRHIDAHDETHWMAVKCVLCYLNSTQGLTILYSNNPGLHTSFDLCVPVSYCDADWGANKIDHKSVSSYMFILAGGPIMWAACSQSTVALSSTEAELTSLSEATKQALYVKCLLRQLKIVDVVIQLHNNNQSTLHLTTQPIHSFHTRMKHYNIKLTHLCDTITQGHLILHYCPTEIMLANILMKALPIACYLELKVLLSLVNLNT